MEKTGRRRKISGSSRENVPRIPPMVFRNGHTYDLEQKILGRCRVLEQPAIECI